MLLAATFAMLSLVTGQAAADSQVARLAAALDSDAFAERERAQRELVARGLKTLDQILGKGAPPEGLSDVEAERHFEKLAARLEAELDHSLYQHFDPLQSLESRSRAEQVRLAIDREAQSRLRLARSLFPRRLPDDAAALVRGYTGGFRESTSWFDAQFTNQSTYKVTSIRILVRTTDKRTGQRVEREAVLGTIKRPLLPGQTVTWSADVGIARQRHHEFFWDTLAVYGMPPLEEPPDDAGEGPEG